MVYQVTEAGFHPELSLIPKPLHLTITLEIASQQPVCAREHIHIVTHMLSCFVLL